MKEENMREECVVCAEEFEVHDDDILQGKTGKPVCPKCKEEEAVKHD
ncbi:hypothetical protein [Candidatus Contubernalis alkaliaceticus]|nr:hypothetical protein [Candidatus Contubernalis alkalaceticus]UNC92067.1 hypothetical protein HUE98_08140 [Candidatus Contubernalis alkalaceticus]